MEPKCDMKLGCLALFSFRPLFSELADFGAPTLPYILRLVRLVGEPER